MYRVTNGKAGGRLAGGPVLLLTTTGRKSGRERTIPLLYLPDDDGLIVVGSNGGTATHPAWWLNLQDNLEATVDVGGRKTRVRATQAAPEEKERLWPRLVRMYGGYEDYKMRTDREIPVVILRPEGDEQA